MDIYEQLKRDEGEVLMVYLDSLGVPTAGVGHNLRAHNLNWPVGTPITQQQSDAWLKEDLQAVIDGLEEHLPDITEAAYKVRYWVLVNMAFNMGVIGLLKFHRMLSAIENGQYGLAANEMADSLWAGIVGVRAKRLEEQMLTGAWQ